MKRLHLMLLANILALFFLTACMAAKYEITTNSGQTYTACDNPQYNVSTDTYVFMDESGSEVTLKKQEIRFIKEQ